MARRSIDLTVCFGSQGWTRSGPSGREGHRLTLFQLSIHQHLIEVMNLIAHQAKLLRHAVR